MDMSPCFLTFPNFKIGLLLGLSYLMPSMFISILIIRLIKTKCFDSTVLMVELEGKVPLSRLSLACHNFPKTFTRILARIFKKYSLFFYTKMFLPLLLCFWNFNPSPYG